MIKTYSYARDGGTRLSDSFRVREFACKDGSDKILIDSALVDFLQRIRNWAGAPVIISSGYRTPAYNTKIGGASSSKHCLGMAADIYVKDRAKSIDDIARFAEAAGMTGIERNEDRRYVHVDTRPGRWLCRYSQGRYIDVATFGGKCPYAEPLKSLRRGSSGNDVRWLQWWLRLWGCDIAVDGVFGAKTEAAVKDIQKRRGLSADGVAGAATRAALKGF